MKSSLEVGRRGWTWLACQEPVMQKQSFQGHIWAAPMTSRVITDCSVEEKEG